MSLAEQLPEATPQVPASADCVAFVGDEETGNLVDSVAQHFFGEPAVVAGDAEAALRYLGDCRNPPRVLIIDIAEDSDPASVMLSLMEALPDDTKLIGVGSVNDIELYRELTQAGVHDYLVKPLSDRMLANVLGRAEDELREIKKSDRPATRIAVTSSRGGVGASTFAVNLGWKLAQARDISTILIDLDIWFGTAALSLDVEPSNGLREALENPSRIDGLFLTSSSAKLTDRFTVMAAEEALTGEMLYYAGATETLIEALSNTYGAVVLDLPRNAFRMRQPVLEAADHIFLVSTLSLPGLRDTIRMLGAIEEGTDAAKVKVVVNRVGAPDEGMTIADFQKALGRKVEYQVPDDPKAFKQAANNGKPLVQAVPKSKAAKAIQAIVEDIPVEMEETAGTGKSGSLLKRLVGKG